ncbi:MAG: thioredoxin domain-containing protein [Bacteroidota bacterium]
MKANKNRLAQASSPYLLQHQNNPVNWYEWSDEALEKAKSENKPILISVGYAACHWCHVMAHESFEDEQVADIMNTHFICIKVDREERPDIDQIYMDAAQILTGRAGWPLNAFALPNGKPFYAATYFPKHNWIKVLQNIHQAYQNQLEQLEETAEKLTQGIQLNDIAEFEPETLSDFKPNDYKDLIASWQKFVDIEKGGFKGAPKFPMPNSWEFLLQYYAFTADSFALEASLTNLNEIGKGGIFDHIGGGFARYSVDDSWHVPHFEKMLYDNAQLISLYAKAYRLFPKDFYRQIINQTIEFVERELFYNKQAFYASLDADSDGEEGTYYVWTYNELKQLIAEEDWNWFTTLYQIQANGNWEDQKNIFHLKQLPVDFAKQQEIPFETLQEKLTIYRQKLHNIRWKRTHPGLDDKILTSWNAMMIRAYVEAAKALQEEKWIDQAAKTADFIKENLCNEKGALYRNFKNNKASIAAFLDDYALLIEALIELYQVNFNKDYLDWAKQLVEICLTDFYDETSGMFFYTSVRSELLIARKMEINDNVIPASNSVLAKALYLLGHFFDEESYRQISQKMLSQVERKMFKSGPYFANWSQLAGWLAFSIKEVAIVGENANKISLALQKDYFPNAIFLGGKAENLALLEGKKQDDQTLIYVCENKTCLQPTTTIAEARKLLNNEH